jgi:hypothetical protein
MVNHQPSKYEALSSNPTTTLKEKKRKEKRMYNELGKEEQTKSKTNR